MENDKKEFILNKIEELLKSHDVHHLKKKFKKDIEKLEKLKIQFCDIHHSGTNHLILVIYLNNGEESKYDMRDFRINLTNQREINSSNF